MKSTLLVIAVCTYPGTFFTRANVYDGAKITILGSDPYDHSGPGKSLRAGNTIGYFENENSLKNLRSFVSVNRKLKEIKDVSLDSGDLLNLPAEKVAKPLVSSGEGGEGNAAGEESGDVATNVNADRDKNLTGEKGENLTGEKGENLTGEKGENLTGEKGENLTGEKGENLTAEKGENLTAEQDTNLTGEKDDSQTGDVAENVTNEKITKLKKLSFGKTDPRDLADLFGTNQHINYPPTYTDFGRRHTEWTNNEDEEIERLAEQLLDNAVQEQVGIDNDIIPVKARPELVLAVVKESLLRQALKPVNVNEYRQASLLRSGDYWNDVWKEDDPKALRSNKNHKKQRKELKVVKANVIPGTTLHKLISTLRNVSPKLLYVINKE